MRLKTVRCRILGSAIAAVLLSCVAMPGGAHAAPVAGPDDPGYPLEFGLDNTGQDVGGKTGLPDADIDAPEAWSMSVARRPVVVAVVDSGIALDQPDLAGRIWTNRGETGRDAAGRARRSNGVDDDGNGYVDDWRGWDFVGDSRDVRGDEDNDPSDPRGHGTHVAGTIAAVRGNGVGVAGIAQNVRLMPVRVQGPRATFSMSDLARGLEYAADNGARIVNVSLADHARSPRVERAIRRHPDVLFVVAANNEGLNLDVRPNRAYPCQMPEANVVCVAATDNSDALASFSDYGARDVDLAAPGTPVLSSQPARTVVLHEGFGGGALTDVPPRWVPGATVGTAAWGSTADASPSGTAIADSPAGPYAGGSDTWLQTAAPIDLRGRHGCSLEQRVRYDTAAEDGFYIQVRSDPGFTGPRADAKDDDPFGYGDTLAFFTGRFAGAKVTDVSDFDGRLLWLRYGLLARSANGAGHDGVALDQLDVSCVGGPYAQDGMAQTELEAGTSMATPHVSGVAALVAGRFPDAGARDIKRRLLAGVDVLPALAHRVRTSGRLNAYKALAESAVAVRDGILRVTAGQGERNRITVQRLAGGRVRVKDPYGTSRTQPASGSRLVPGAGCRSTAATTVTCRGAVTSVRVRAGDLDDRVTLGRGVAGTAQGGAGDDTLVGGRAARLLGGAGQNRILRR